MASEREDALKTYRERVRRLLALDHFAALGVARAASPADVHKAFVEAAKTWHPDRVPADLGDDLRPLFAQAFSRLETARATLSDPARRLRYVEELATPAKRASAGDLTVAEASLEFKKAEALLKKNDAAQAEQHLRRAVQLAPANVAYAALLVWIQVKPTTPREQLQSLARDLDGLVARDGACERAFFFRGQLRKRLGLEKEAYGDFVRASELDPANIDAQREVRLYRMRHERGADTRGDGEASAPEGVGGFFRKIFKR